MSNERWGFNIEYANNTVIKVKVMADKALSMPPRTPGVSGSEQYKLVTNLRVETYAGYVWKVPAIRSTEIQVVAPKGQLESALNKGASLAEALATNTYSVAADGTVLFSRILTGATDLAGIDIPYEPSF